MKRLMAAVLAVFFLTGCADDELDTAMRLRDQLQNSDGCEFDVTVTADYGDALHEFGMHCQMDELGDISFTVTAPETISGISGKITEGGGQLTFDDQVLAFPLLADGQLSPVSAPWILIHTLRSGYLNACTQTQEGTMLVIDDSYAEDALQLDIWLDENDLPVSAEILYEGLRILSLEVSAFTYV